MVKALIKRADWRSQYDAEPEWAQTPLNLTPEKKKRNLEKRVANAVRGCGVGEVDSSPEPSVNEGFLCRAVCLTLSPPLWDLYHSSKGKISRAEHDAKETGANHGFYVQLAEAMINVDWKDSNGNKPSVPSDHSADERAPECLLRQLRSVDLDGAARGLQNECRLQWHNKRPAFMFDLQKRCVNWLKDVRKNHTVSGTGVVFHGMHGYASAGKTLECSAGFVCGFLVSIIASGGNFTVGV